MKITRFNINGNFLWIKFIFYEIKKQMILINVISMTKIAISFMTFLKWGIRFNTKFVILE